MTKNWSGHRADVGGQVNGQLQHPVPPARDHRQTYTLGGAGGSLRAAMAPVVLGGAVIRINGDFDAGATGDTEAGGSPLSACCRVRLRRRRFLALAPDLRRCRSSLLFFFFFFFFLSFFLYFFLSLRVDEPTFPSPRFFACSTPRGEKSTSLRHGYNHFASVPIHTPDPEMNPQAPLGSPARQHAVRTFLFFRSLRDLSLSFFGRRFGGFFRCGRRLAAIAALSR